MGGRKIAKFGIVMDYLESSGWIGDADAGLRRVLGWELEALVLWLICVIRGCFLFSFFF